MSCAVGPVAQEVVHSLPKAALPAHGMKVDATTVPLVGLLEKMTVNQLVLSPSTPFSSFHLPVAFLGCYFIFLLWLRWGTSK